MHTKILGFLILTGGTVFSGEIILPSGALERDAPVWAFYRTNAQATGKGELALQWSDVHGRLVENRKIPFELADETDVGFPVDLRRAAAMKNELRAHFSFEGVNKQGARDHREEDAQVSFIARPPDRRWWDYIIMMWQSHTPALVAVLKTLGINGGQYNGRGRTPPEFLLRNDLRWYVENIATDFYSEYHRWRFDRPTNWAFTQTKELYKKDPSSKEALKRHPSLSDPAWIRKIHDRLVESARFWSPYRPVFYSLGDESGIADLAAYWDFDFSDQSLVEMRSWLKERYGTLTALNRQWGTAFSAWNLVTPMTTNEAMRRTDDNFSAWSDHKEWMDVSFARALKMGTEAIHEVDPEAYVSIGGAQMPGWGGYDYSRLTQALTALEPYDIGNNVEIIRSLNPRLAMVTTAFARGPWEKQRVWYELLHGSRGLILWDNGFEFVTREGAVAPRGQEVAPYYNEIRSGLGALLAASSRQRDPIAIHYSQPSMRAEWMMAQRPKGEAWVNRTSSTERMDSAFLRLRESYCRLLEDLGLQYNFVAYGQVEQGELLRGGYRVLILPRSSALSEAEAQGMREFAGQGGVIIADGVPGVFDEHCRRLEKPRLAEVKTISVDARTLSYHQDRLAGKEGEVHQLMGRLLKESGVQPAFTVTDETGRPPVGVETHIFRNGGVTLLALLSNPQLRVDELGPPEFKSNGRFEKPRTLRVSLPAESYVYEVRAAKALGPRRELSVPLDPYEPAMFAISALPLPALRVSTPARLARGQSGRIAVSFRAASPAATHVLHVDIIDPAGKIVSHYSGNLLAPNGRAVKLLPLAYSDVPGKWEIRVKDLLSGQAQAASLEVF